MNREGNELNGTEMKPDLPPLVTPSGEEPIATGGRCF
jgi:hypothetical protein